MSEKKGCGCGKKNIAPTPSPENPPAQGSDSVQFRSAGEVEGGIKKN